MVIAIVYLILVLNDYQIWWNKEIIMCSYVLMFHVSDLHYHDSTSICFACLGFHSKWEHTISWALMQMPDSLLMAVVQENIYRARSIHCIVCRRIGSKKAVLWQFVSFELARVGYKKWLFEAKNGTQRAKIQKTNCKIGAMHHSTTAQWFSTSDSVVHSYGGPQPSTPQCPRPLAGQRHQVRVLPIASNHGCTFPAPIFMVHQFI